MTGFLQSGLISTAEFGALMTVGEPFETLPHVAVGVSGGLDSMALCLLMDRWARERGGRVTALTVDHGLRPESATEAAAVGAWLGARGVAHSVLRWSGKKPERGIQAAAREARLGLLSDWCRFSGVLHLALAHHLEDQAETFLLRLGRGSGVVGLSAMAPVSIRAFGRLLRPLLDVPRARIEATDAAFGQSWIEDPSNHNTAYARVRVRARLIPALQVEGITTDRLARTASLMGRARAALEAQAAGLLSRVALVDSMGFALVDSVGLVAAPEEIGLRVLARLLAAIGGAAYPPRHDRLERLYNEVRLMGGGCTLGGCQVAPFQGLGSRGRILICREAASASEVVGILPSIRVRWDRRFNIETGSCLPAGSFVAALGAKGWAKASATHPEKLRRAIPTAVRESLPALFNAEGILAVPHLGYSSICLAEAGAIRVAFAPDIPIAPPLALWRRNTK